MIIIIPLKSHRQAQWECSLDPGHINLIAASWTREWKPEREKMIAFHQSKTQVSAISAPAEWTQQTQQKKQRNRKRQSRKKEELHCLGLRASSVCKLVLVLLLARALIIYLLVLFCRAFSGRTCWCSGLLWLSTLFYKFIIISFRLGAAWLGLVLGLCVSVCPMIVLIVSC